MKRGILYSCRGGLIPRGSAAVIKVLNPRPIPYENNIPRGSAPRLLIGPYAVLHYHRVLEMRPNSSNKAA
jgi:hypothetical protein